MYKRRRKGQTPYSGYMHLQRSWRPRAQARMHAELQNKPERINQRRVCISVQPRSPHAYVPHLDLVHVDVSPLRDVLREQHLTPLIAVIAGSRISVTRKIAGLPRATGVDCYPNLPY